MCHVSTQVYCCWDVISLLFLLWLDCRCLHGVCDNRPGSLGVCRWSTCQEGYSGDYCDKTATPCNSDGLSEHCHVHAYCREEDGLTTSVFSQKTAPFSRKCSKRFCLVLLIVHQPCLCIGLVGAKFLTSWLRFFFFGGGGGFWISFQVFLPQCISCVTGVCACQDTKATDTTA